tara:strand:+ start:1298 stop:1648 length:351 start_codon:yes stop_codon:yes gene_type:complete
MKTSALKSLVKEAVREAIQEELKDILLEAVKSPKIIAQPQMVPVVENVVQPTAPQMPTMSATEKRDAYKNILGDTQASFNTNTAQHFQPQAGMDTTNGTLPAGEVDMSQIMGLMSK